MSRKVSLALVAVTAVAAMPPAAHVRAASTPAAPQPFGKYLVYSMAGVFDPSVPPAEGDLATWFHRDVMASPA